MQNCLALNDEIITDCLCLWCAMHMICQCQVSAKTNLLILFFYKQWILASRLPDSWPQMIVFILWIVGEYKKWVKSSQFESQLEGGGGPGHFGQKPTSLIKLSLMHQYNYGRGYWQRLISIHKMILAETVSASIMILAETHSYASSTLMYTIYTSYNYINFFSIWLLSQVRPESLSPSV